MQKIDFTASRRELSRGKQKPLPPCLQRWCWFDPSSISIDLNCVARIETCLSRVIRFFWEEERVEGQLRISMMMRFNRGDLYTLAEHYRIFLSTCRKRSQIRMMRTNNELTEHCRPCNRGGMLALWFNCYKLDWPPKNRKFTTTPQPPTEWRPTGRQAIASLQQHAAAVILFSLRH